MLYFHNPGHLDLNALSLISVSAKQSENAIGRFGTGLKYAIAIILRHGGQITIETGGRAHTISTEPLSFRDKEFQRVLLNGQPLPFTLDYGKDWPLWTAYRELLSNALDEGGEVTTARPEADTIIAVDLQDLEKIHYNRDEIFLPKNRPLTASTRELEVSAGRTTHLYYNNIRVYTLPKGQFSFTYNLIGYASLTEDRTLADLYYFNSPLRALVESTEDEAMLESLALQDEGFYDTTVQLFGNEKPQPAFFNVVRRLRNNFYLNTSWKRLLEAEEKETKKYEFIPFTPEQEARVKDACTLLRAIRCYPEDFEIRFGTGLGDHIVAFADMKEKIILLSDRAFTRDDSFLAEVLYEEWAHLEHKVVDETREFQSFLIQQLIRLAKHL